MTRKMILLILINLTFMAVAQPKTILEVIDSLSLAVVDEQLSKFTPAAEDSIVIDITMLTSEKGDYLYTILGNRLIGKGWNVYRNFNQIKAFQGKVLRITRFQANRWYQEESSDSDGVLRNLYVDIKGQLYNGRTGKILAAFSGEKNYRDYINKQQMELEKNSVDTNIIEKKQNLTVWDKMIEPALVLTSAAVIVYLFFSQRF